MTGALADLVKLEPITETVPLLIRVTGVVLGMIGGVGVNGTVTLITCPGVRIPRLHCAMPFTAAPQVPGLALSAPAVTGILEPETLSVKITPPVRSPLLVMV